MEPNYTVDIRMDEDEAFWLLNVLKKGYKSFLEQYNNAYKSENFKTFHSLYNDCSILERIIKTLERSLYEV